MRCRRLQHRCCSGQGIQGLCLNAFSCQSTTLLPVSWSKNSQPLVVTMIGNECAEPSVCSVLGLLPLVLLQVDISQASLDTQIGKIGLVAIPELEGSAAKCTVREAVVDVVGGMSSLPALARMHVALSARSLKPRSALPFCCGVACTVYCGCMPCSLRQAAIRFPMNSAPLSSWMVTSLHAGCWASAIALYSLNATRMVSSRLLVSSLSQRQQVKSSHL